MLISQNLDLRVYASWERTQETLKHINPKESEIEIRITGGQLTIPM